MLSGLNNSDVCDTFSLLAVNGTAIPDTVRSRGGAGVNGSSDTKRLTPGAAKGTGARTAIGTDVGGVITGALASGNEWGSGLTGSLASVGVGAMGDVLARAASTGGRGALG